MTVLRWKVTTTDHTGRVCGIELFWLRRTAARRAAHYNLFSRGLLWAKVERAS